MKEEPQKPSTRSDRITTTQHPLWRAFGTCFIIIGFTIFLCQTGGLGDLSLARAEKDPPLSDLIHNYVFTTRGVDAGRQLDNILNHPQATFEHLVALIKQSRRYQSQASQPVGLLPSQPVMVRGQTYQYGLHVPDSYTPDQAYPVLLCLHGAGFTGNAYLDRWSPRLGDTYIVACPTTIKGDWWTRTAEDLILATLHTVQARYHVDPNRIFLTGMSNGAIGTWIVGSHHAFQFAGLAPMAGGIDRVLFPFLENLRNTPLYIIHGRQDQVMPVRLSRSIAEALSRLEYPYVFREHNRRHPIAGGHFFPREELPALIDWLNKQRRDPLPTRLTVVRDATHLTTFGWVRIDATDRIAAFSENLSDSRDEWIQNTVYARLEATVTAPNHIAVQTHLVRQYTIFLSETEVDFSKPLTVFTNGEVSYTGMVTRSPRTLLRQARIRQDTTTLFAAKLRQEVPQASHPAP